MAPLDEQATKETIDEEGWVHTGDVGLMDEVCACAVNPSRYSTLRVV
jgi:acyl-CoA synthetase (AMP-forming)/AMP-acid ligase II